MYLETLSNTYTSGFPSSFVLQIGVCSLKQMAKNHVVRLFAATNTCSCFYSNYKGPFCFDSATFLLHRAIVD